MPTFEKLKRGLKIKKQQAFLRKFESIPKSNKDSYECFASALTANGYLVTAKKLKAQHEAIKTEHQRLKWLKKSERVTQWFRKKVGK